MTITTDPADVDLDAWLYPDDDLPTSLDHDLAPPPDADRADRMLAARRRQLDRIADVQALAARRRAEIDEWEAAQVAKLSGRVEWLEASLTAWHAAVIRLDPSRTSIELPSGTLKSTAVAGGAEWEWVDDTAVTTYLAEEAPELTAVPPPTEPKRRPDKKAVKAAVAVVDDVAAARDARRAYVGAGGPIGADVPPRFVAGTGVDGELVPVLDLDTGQPVPGLMVRRVARRFTIR